MTISSARADDADRTKVTNESTILSLGDTTTSRFQFGSIPKPRTMRTPSLFDSETQQLRDIRHCVATNFSASLPNIRAQSCARTSPTQKRNPLDWHQTLTENGHQEEFLLKKIGRASCRER